VWFYGREDHKCNLQIFVRISRSGYSLFQFFKNVYIVCKGLIRLYGCSSATPNEIFVEVLKLNKVRTVFQKVEKHCPCQRRWPRETYVSKRRGAFHASVPSFFVRHGKRSACGHPRSFRFCKRSEIGSRSPNVMVSVRWLTPPSGCNELKLTQRMLLRSFLQHTKVLTPIFFIE